jgi:hypothetical protein
LRTHLIEPEYLHRDDFDGFYQHRKQQLIELIEKAMGKVVITALDEEPVSDETDEEEDHIQT